MRSRVRPLAVLSTCLAASLTGPALAQFDAVTPATNILEQLGGQLLNAEGAPTPEPGDQVAAFFGDQPLAVFTFTSTQTDPRAWGMVIFGDDPNTGTVKEGPAPGDIITFRFFDASTNMTRLDLAPTNAQGETINVPFEGGETIDLGFNFPGAPPFNFTPTPSTPFDLTLGVAAPAPPTNPTGSNPTGAGAAAGGNPDVNGDGRVDKLDAAVVLRIMVGAVRGVSTADAARADVNGDGVVNIEDAIAIISPRASFPNQP